ncbi:trypsin epsilon-like [Hyposmocoma kahamanoa]|uniref:trypsin epsilon-like n=1 Tax=Hyposmocoma kahamanoa TaxID=1477025 RepID=UPI000E6D97FB|nr:trypsin epsilon-like [Hyposmocoma kahamanoa]
MNGVSIDIEQYPYTAQIIVHVGDDVGLCGGAVVSKRVVVTASHCIYANDQIIPAADIDVLLGSSYSMAGTPYDACKALKHPNYAENEHYYFWDVGLILLTRKIKLSKAISIATIADYSAWRNVKYSMSIAGFGKTGNTEDRPDRLSVTRMQYVDKKICNASQNIDTEARPVPDHMFCMVGTTTTSDCPGDSGTAITWKTFIVGLVALGRDSRDDSCGSEALPSMYTDLTHFRKWIMHNIQELESITTKNCEAESELHKLMREEKLKKKKKEIASGGDIPKYDC